MDAYTANNGYLTTETDPTVNAAAKADLSTCAAGDALLFGSSGWECSTNVSGTGKWSDGTTADSIVYTSGNVGIGTTSPNAHLEIDSKGGAPSETFSTTASNASLSLASSDGNTGIGTGTRLLGGIGGSEYAWFQAQNSISAAGNNAKNISLNPVGGNVGIGTSSPAARLHVESTNRANSINRSCPAGTLWAGHIAGKASVDWNNDGYTDGNDYNILLGIDTNDYLEDNECVVFGTSTIGTDIDSGEFWVDTNLNRIVDEGEVITGANLGNLNVSGGKVSCEAGYLWLDQNTNGTAPETGECIAPQYDDDSVILRTDFTGETCPVGTQKRDENQDGNTDDGECHIPAVLAQDSGNLGIGTTDPQQALHVNGGIMASSLLLEDSSNPTLQAEGFFAHSHSIATNAGADFESFVIDGETYLAVANYYNDSTRDVDSKIYKWNSATSNFDEFQIIPEVGTFDFEVFVIDGEAYLAVINVYDGSSWNIDSKIYKWDGSQFNDTEKNIPTSGAHDAESFVIDGETYLAIPHYNDGSTYSLNSKIYKWNSGTDQFDELQDIPTIGPLDFESFVIDGETYLAVANYHDGSGYSFDSKIYKWNGSAFAEAQSIPTIGANHFESFTIDGEMYLAVANRHGISRTYKWNGSTFVEEQSFGTNQARAFESFVANGETYLAVANGEGDRSRIYKWNGSSFAEEQAIPTNNAHDVASFVIDGKTYLGVTNYYNGSTYNINSHIYTYDSFLTLSSTSTLAEDNPLFVFQNGEEELVTIENSGNVGIGTSSPGAKLDIRDSSGTSEIQLQDRTLAYRHAYKTLSTEEGGSWYRIAEKESGRASARFAVNEVQSSRHSTAAFYASSFYSNNNYWNSSLSLLNRSIHSGNSCIRKVRIVTGDATYDPAYVEIFVYNNATSTNDCRASFSIYDNEHNEGWYPVDFLKVPEDAESPEYEALSPGQHSNNAQPYYYSDSVLDFTGTPIMAVANKTGDIFRVNSNGTVGIGTGSIGTTCADDARLCVNGNIYAQTTKLNSDSRLKKSVETIPSALEKILSLRGVTFEWKQEEFPERNFADGTQIGLIAQEVEEVFPELVSQGEYKSVSYANLVSPLIEAVKELHALYQGHADRIVALEAQNQQLLETIADLQEKNTEQDNHIAHQDERIAHQDELIVQLEVRLAALEAMQ